MGMDLTEECRAGFDAAPGEGSPHMATSPADDAWRVGRWLGATGRPRPAACARSRGSTYRVGGIVVAARWSGGRGGVPPTWEAERVA